MEAEVVQDIAEMSDRDIASLLLIVEIKGILEIRQDISWQRELRSLAWVHASSVYAFLHFSYFILFIIIITYLFITGIWGFGEIGRAHV